MGNGLCQQRRGEVGKRGLQEHPIPCAIHVLSLTHSLSLSHTHTHTLSLSHRLHHFALGTHPVRESCWWRNSISQPGRSRGQPMWLPPVLPHLHHMHFCGWNVFLPSPHTTFLVTFSIGSVSRRNKVHCYAPPQAISRHGPA